MIPLNSFSARKDMKRPVYRISLTDFIQAREAFIIIISVKNPCLKVCAWNLNQLLSGMIPYRDEKLSFLLMLLPIFHSTDGRTVRIYYCDALSEHFRPDVKKYIRNGNEKGNMCCQEPDIMADIILSNINGLWTGICDRIMTYEEMRTETDLTELLRMTECYRLVIERSLSIPYGTLELNEMLSLKTLCEQIHNHWSY